jgi:HEAT repeat protein
VKSLCLVAAVAGLLNGASSQPDVINGKVETRPLAGPLTAEFHNLETTSSAGPFWAAYTVPMVPRQGEMCGNDERHSNLVHLEGPDTLVVLFRFENRALDRVRISSLDCQFDAGGLSFVLLTGVQPAQSVELLGQLAHSWTQTGRKPHFDSIISAIGLTRDPAADRMLESMLAASEPEPLREKVLFWLANARGRAGFEAVRKALQSDASDRVRERATFALSVSKEPGVNQALEDAARNDHTPRVRSQALFWLAHKAGRDEAALILRAAEQDPAPEVRRQAVFALEQIPEGGGIPLLIQLAKTSQDKKVREQAMFWLGRSKDPQAMKFFEDLLK